MDKAFRSIVVVAGVGFLILVIWRNPNTAATQVGDVFANIGNFLQEVLSKLADFFASFGSK